MYRKVLRGADGGGRKVRTPQGSAPGNARSGQPEGKWHRKYTARLRSRPFASRASARQAPSPGGACRAVARSTLNNADVNGFTYQGVSKYATVDVRVVHRFDRNWSAAVGIDNLNDYHYWNFHPYPQRTYAAELKFDY